MTATEEPRASRVDVKPPNKNIYKVNKKSVRLSAIDWLSVFFAQYLTPLFYASAVVVSAQLALIYWNADPKLVSLVFNAVASHLTENWVVYAPLLAVTLTWWFRRRAQPVYLVDFATFKPPKSWQVSHDDIKEVFRLMDSLTDESRAFLDRIMAKGATGQATHWPPNTHKMIKAGVKAKIDDSMAAAREESDVVIFGVFEELMKKTNLKPKDIDFLIINCSLFSPTPSLCASVCNKFNLPSTTRTFNLSGMGCSASLISVDLAKSLLSAHPNSTAVVISTENLTQNLYGGNERAFLLQNTLFRVGGAAMLFSNRLSAGFSAKYKLLHLQRVQNTSDEGLNCVYETQDKEGNRGIRLAKNITTVAGKGLRDNLTLLGPHVLPLREQAKVVVTAGCRWLFRNLQRKLEAQGLTKLAASIPRVKVYIPDFTASLDHMCIHAGGRAVIDGVEENLKLQPYMLEPSRKTLETFGNTSSSSIWYELEYIENRRGTHHLRKSERIMMVAFGSGFKVNSAVLLRLR